MSLFLSLSAGLRNLIRRDRAHRDLDDELSTFLEMSAQDQQRRGIDPALAARAVRLEHGTVDTTRESVRASAWESAVESFLQDFRFGFRTLLKNPGFTAVAVLTLALGVGANTAIFSVVYAILLKPLPYVQSGELFNIYQTQTRDAALQTGWSYPNLDALRSHNRVFRALAGVSRHQLVLSNRGPAQNLDTAVVTGDFFSLFDARPISGRVISPADAKPGAAPVVVISEKLWRGTLGADPNIIGASLTLDKRLYTVIGIMPADFPFPLFSQVPRPPQIWEPLPQDPLFSSWMPRRGGHWLQVTGRLQPGVSMAAVQAELEAFAASLAKDAPAENAGWFAGALPLQDMIVGKVKSALFILLGAVGLVLLIACANIANLLLTRATARTREIAVRASLGAGRARIVRQLLSETAALGLCGGIAGIVLAYFGVRILAALIPPTIPIVNTIQVDAFVLLFALAISLLASLAFGLTPAFLIARTDLQIDLREGGSRSGSGAAGRRARNILASAEIALAMTLLVAAGLLLRSFANLTAVDPGFHTRHLVKAEIDLPRSAYPKPRQWVEFTDNLLRQLQAQPGMADSALCLPAPIANSMVNLGFGIVGRPAPPPNSNQTGDYVAVSTSYFHTMGIPLVSGRLLDDHDIMSAPNVTVISQTLARSYFPNQDPIGQQLSFAFPPEAGIARQVVGVVADVRDTSLGDAPKPMFYVPFAQSPFAGAIIVVNSPLSLSAVSSTLRQDVARLDKDVPVVEVAAMPDILNESVAQPRFRTFLLTLFAAIALILAATGIFGVISYSVARRSHEIGIRMALGASRSTILQLISRETFALVASGVIVGSLAALAASRLLGNLLFGVSSTDPLTIAAVALTLAVVAALAAYLPARRATRIDPVVALRDE